MAYSYLFVICLYISLSRAALHNLFVGTFSNAAIYSLQFDDVRSELTLKNNISVEAAHIWISLSHDKRNLYAPGDTGFYSYAVENGSSLRYQSSLALSEECISAEEPIFTLPSANEPYNVYGVNFGNCGVVMSTSSDGSLSSAIQNYSYANNSGIHGLALSPNGKYLYSADDSGNAIWTHAVNETTGKLKVLNRLPGPRDHIDPRHVTVHKSGSYLYAVLEAGNELLEISLDKDTGLPSYTNVSYLLIPSGYNNSDYFSDEVNLSANGSYLWTSTRAYNTKNTGYISAFSLDGNGHILKQLFLLPTTTDGGGANAVAPSFFSDKYVALTDHSQGFVQIWEFTSDNSTAGAKVVAQVNIDDNNGCCANAVWYS